ncbi:MULTISPECIES: sugar ABC transporter permease [Fictibacillus]|jgi:arabinogalactan oligomer / maltooligosaccharide transport system permease protein|uniref:sugar ABC transporter permease n=1 Tax=Fictibacillus TaxID=1329200 RepID=UPI0018CC8D57|nr:MULTISPECIES: sugar ABC transporter permease [Fictibacillus]MBH0155598.1 sugar ABC transporter permease [Fictibacillus sp. 5RED26]MBH0161256.1 sugar ABC transporter permease [Fictibacillus sp. 26RED30]MBH0166160.1 sugar ABC transporter permease [Fictibacillus sp. 7GRE50]MBH0172791.1 sugar ABC transporter permease [Fictibacillus sp. 23RED33]MED1862879.1 sugar ABC transporter permease [Fictibacillus nanhaiensis]
MSIKTARRIRLTLSYLVLLSAIAIVVYPILWVIGSSFNPGNTLSSSTIIPENATLAHYKELFAETDYLIWYWNTLKICFITMVLSVIFIGLTAYAFSRYKFVGRKNGLLLFLILQMIPQFVAILAIYILAYQVGLLDTHFALILVYVGGLIPMNTYLAKNYYDTIPKELDESARIDGAGHFRIFWQIILPLSKPILAVIALFSFISPFADFILASILISSDEKMTLAVGLFNMIKNEFGNSFTLFAAGSVLVAIPIGLLFLSLQRYFISGLTAGGTKG